MFIILFLFLLIPQCLAFDVISNDYKDFSVWDNGFWLRYEGNSECIAEFHKSYLNANRITFKFTIEDAFVDFWTTFKVIVTIRVNYSDITYSDFEQKEFTFIFDFYNWIGITTLMVLVEDQGITYTFGGNSETTIIIYKEMHYVGADLRFYVNAFIRNDFDGKWTLDDVNYPNIHDVWITVKTIRTSGLGNLYLSLKCEETYVGENYVREGEITERDPLDILVQWFLNIPNRIYDQLKRMGLSWILDFFDAIGKIASAMVDFIVKFSPFMTTMFALYLMGILFKCIEEGSIDPLFNLALKIYQILSNIVTAIMELIPL